MISQITMKFNNQGKLFFIGGVCKKSELEEQMELMRGEFK